MTEGSNYCLGFSFFVFLGGGGGATGSEISIGIWIFVSEFSSGGRSSSQKLILWREDSISSKPSTLFIKKHLLIQISEACKFKLIDVFRGNS